jgi:ribosomal protein S18 acetylase RimI-like enzyme
MKEPRTVKEGMDMNRKTKLTGSSPGHDMVVRIPTVARDLDRLAHFFAALPIGVRNTLRYRATDQDFLRHRLEQLDERHHWRLVAEIDGMIVGDATMDREPFGWTLHVAEVRAVVEPGHSLHEVESVLFRELAAMGRKAGVERLFTEVMKGQTRLVRELEREGFVYEATRKKYAKDPNGKLHDVIIMSNDLEKIWKALADCIDDLDFQVGRNMAGAY